MIILKQNIGGREEQQDSYYYGTYGNTILAVVADGLGGMRNGKKASEIVCHTAKILFEKEPPKLKMAITFLKGLKSLAQKEIRKRSLGSFSTIAVLLIIGNKAFIMHSGDTRVYHFNGKRFIKRTRDHSITQILVEQGKISEEQMGKDINQGKLYQSLGGETDYEADIDTVDNLQKGDWFLLCSDGFWGNLSLEDIATLESKSEIQAEELLSKARNIGGNDCDNITFMCIYPKLSFTDAVKSNSIKLLNRSIRNKNIIFCLLLIIILSSLIYIINANKRIPNLQKELDCNNISVKSDPKKKLLDKRSTGQGNATAQYNLENRYHKEVGCKKEYSENRKTVQERERSN